MPNSSELEERIRSLELDVKELKTNMQPLLQLSGQLATISAQLADLKVDLASFKGKASGTALVATFFVPALISAAVAALFGGHK
jgi:hypothetical protein